MSSDAALYLSVTDFAASTPWLAGLVIAFSVYGLALLVPAFMAMLWWAKSRGAAAVAAVVWVPCAVVLAYVIDLVVKHLVAEVRPCRVVAGSHPLLPCDPPTDFSFPSNHAAMVAAFAAAVFLVRRGWGVIAGVFALLMAASRVYVGAHYPHDVLAGLVLGAVVGLLGVAVRVRTTRLVDRVLRRTRLVTNPGN
ncbi:phosphatase PAP2 family protein [Allokutzneria oryzae]|uniref:Phosphatase PAP2 family protein n=1 Tax=Allokutzneria oryzae TaxID=1378989 RepID=A0ABV5ZZ76_9PSEU